LTLEGLGARQVAKRRSTCAHAATIVPRNTRCTKRKVAGNTSNAVKVSLLLHSMKTLQTVLSRSSLTSSGRGLHMLTAFTVTTTLATYYMPPRNMSSFSTNLLLSTYGEISVRSGKRTRRYKLLRLQLHYGHNSVV